MKPNHLTQFELATRERELYMQKPRGAMLLVAALVLGAALVAMGLLGVAIDWMLNLL